MKYRIPAFAAALGATLALSSCIYYEHPRPVVYSSRPVAYVPPPAPVIVDPAPVAVYPWVPAGGFHDRHHFDYYPAEQVYYCTDTRQWWWVDGGAWRADVRLPGSIRVSGHFVGVDLDGPRPDRFHTQVVRVYPRTYRVEDRPIVRPPGRGAGGPPGPPPGRGMGGPPGPPPGRGRY